MDLATFLDHVRRGAVIEGGSELHAFMHDAGQEALRTVAELNSGYRSPEEVRALLSRLTGTTVDASVTVFPPFYSEFGKNLVLGRDVFVNQGCRFQDTGGISVGDGTLIGHGCTLTTLDHAMDPARRADMVPAPVVLGRHVWLGASVTIVPGVTVGRRRGRRRRGRRHPRRPARHGRRRRPRPGHQADRLRQPDPRERRPGDVLRAGRARALRPARRGPPAAPGRSGAPRSGRGPPPAGPPRPAGRTRARTGPHRRSPG